MKNKIFLLPVVAGVFAVAFFLILPASGQQSIQFTTQSQSISCGNNACEEMSFQLRVGEEKTLQLGERSYRFKLTEVRKVAQTQTVNDPNGQQREETYYRYDAYISIDGGEPVLGDRLKDTLGFEASANANYREYGQEAEGAYLRFSEMNVCPVPDCAVPLEVNVQKKWNLVPIFLLFGLGLTGRGEEVLNKGTCKLQDFTVIYAYDSVRKEAVKLYSFGYSENDLENAYNNFKRNTDSERVLMSTPFNSVWIYSRNQCTLSTIYPKPFANDMLAILAAMTAQAPQAPVAYPAGGQPPAPQPQPETPKFAQGWNFWMGSNDMAGRSFDEIKGTCAIEKAYTFEATTQLWKELNNPLGPSDSFVFKVSSKCMLGYAVAPPPSPPG